jgi:rod shape-determining protein MreD
MTYLIALLLSGGAVVLQTTLFGYISIAGAKPDLALIIILFVANSRGRMEGQVTGFFTGMIEDILSIAPLGFHMILKTVLGFLYGLTKGSVFMDPILMPFILAVTGTALKGLLMVIISALFSLSLNFATVFNLQFLIEMGYNGLLSPLVFALLPLVKPLARRRGR